MKSNSSGSKQYSFFRRQFLTLIVLSVVPLGLTLSTTLNLVKDEIILQTTSKLETVADLKSSEVNQWLDQGQEVAMLVSKLTEFQEYLPHLLEVNGGQTFEIHPDLFEMLDTTVEIFPSVQSISILHPENGAVMHSTDGTLLGRSRVGEDYFIEGKEELYVSSVVYSVGREKPILTISTPIFAEDSHLAAVAAVEMNLADLELAMLEKSNLGETGRAYLIEKFGFYVTLPQESPEGTIYQIVESEGALNALNNFSGNSIYLNQWNVSVLGVYRWLPEANMGLLVEIEEAEMISQYTQIAIAISLAELILLGLFIFSARTVAQWLASPINRIAQTARSLQEGKMEERAPLGGPKEIHQLAVTFNEMAESIQHSQEELEKMVEIRTLALKRAEARLENIVQTAPDAIISINEEHHVVMFNDAAEEMLGYERKDVVGKDINIFIPSKFHQSHKKSLQDFSPERNHHREMNIGRPIRAIRKNGKEFPAEASISSAVVGEQQIMTVIMRDVTRRAEAEKLIKNSLFEKETLLQEIHHRVKNNLQIISSLLYLQGKKIDDPIIYKEFDESRNRIRSMALLHEKLYMTPNLAKINLGEYLDNLVEDVIGSYREQSTGVKFLRNLDNIWVNIETAMPCGLIINELVTNTIKYAFPNGEKGTVKINLHQMEEGEINLIIEDDGVGLPSDLDLENTDTLGLSLVTNLVSQLGGTLNLNLENGTAYLIQFRQVEVKEKVV